MFQLVYSSDDMAGFSPAQLSELLAKSRSNNQKVGITGMLLHQGGKFLQVVEGEEPVVRKLIATIAADPRHGRIEVLHQSISDRRDFPDWSMGFHSLDSSKGAVAGFTSFLDSTLSLAQFAADPPRAKALLLAFKDGVPLDEQA